ncbi:Methyltransferase domain-containing protein [Cognatiyoonia sediminum]|uniref:Methyltransferase domain-containing protein n=1 Tax=Cognatiyoonia sediminum TaxID=1508389 RepID=A0A1M5RWW9_9RHOB|nr:methyltransferase domain-containing protein [Cognatiyoonia sediminum]SHH30725.1 Methyltransferase domain-containing protein [Cognatiyoonia sediminum]
MTDKTTIDVYDGQAEEYAKLVQQDGPDEHLQAFIDLIPENGTVLDLGSGPAAASAHMRAAGLVPDPVDASLQMVELANRTHDIGARQATFDDISGEELYDGIWANFSLLHAPRSDLPRHIETLCAALKTGGVFHIGMKTGEGEQRDRIGRKYTYVSVNELNDLLDDAGLSVNYTDEGSAKGLDGTDAPWVICRATKNG